MKKTGKFLGAAVVCCMIFGLTACGGKEVKGAATCTIEQNGVEVSMVLDAKGDKITKITQTSTINQEGLGEEQIAALGEVIENAKKSYGEIEGVSYSTEEKDNMLIEVVEISTDKDTLKEVIDKELLPVEGENVTQLSLEDTVDNLKSAGWTIEEK